MRPGTQKRLKNTLIFYAVVIIIWPLRLLPHRAALCLGAALGWLTSWLPLPEVRRADRNLADVLPELNAKARLRLRRAALTNMGQTALEWLSGPDPAGPKVTFTPGSLERLEQVHGQGKGLLFITGHLGNWELMGAAVAARLPGQVSVLFKPSYDPRFTRLMTWARARSGVNGIDVSRPSHLAVVLRTLRAGGLIGLLQDQPVDSGPWIPFLDRPAPSSTLAGQLALRHGIPVLLGHIARGPGGRHTISIQEVPGVCGSNTPEEATLRIHQSLDRAIRARPDNWIWTLDRWRTKSR